MKSQVTIELPPVERAEEVQPEQPPIEIISASSEKREIQRAAQKSGDVSAMLLAITGAHTPQEQTKLLRDAMQWAVDQKNSYMVMQLLRFELEYGVGKPIQRQVTATLTPEQFAARYRDDD